MDRIDPARRVFILVAGRRDARDNAAPSELGYLHGSSSRGYRPELTHIGPPGLACASRQGSSCCMNTFTIPKPAGSLHRSPYGSMRPFPDKGGPLPHPCEDVGRADLGRSLPSGQVETTPWLALSQARRAVMG